MTNTKKQADNGFGKGLVMDSHPINANNNTLSNCLNGTLVTYNGNEMMLQNDMGNGRVETAYLPPGYVPIGMKEHGGIIYVASYNPLTNRGQLGSFPSPERNISSLEKGSSSLQIDSSTFGFNNLTGVDTLYSKIALLDEKTLRPGDKFSLSFSADNLENLKNLLTAYDNSGATKLLTIKVAIKDFNGNLTDITEDLKTFDNNYFMYQNSKQDFENFSVDDMRNQTDNDKFNIYGGRLSGELYLIAELATINDYELLLSGNSTEESDTRILTFKNQFKQDIEGIYKGSWIQLTEENGTSESGFVPASDVSNSHTINVADVTPKGKLTYSITPVLTYAKLNSMTKSGVIDMNLFGTGEIAINEWRYYNDISNGKLTINWGMETYLRNDDLSTEYINEVIFNFFKFEDNEFVYDTSITTKSRKNYNGNFNESIPYDELSSGQLYIVQIAVNILYNEEKRTEYFYKILYTSEYFNQFYSDGETSDFMTKSIDLKVESKADLKESQNYITPGNKKQSPTYSMLKVPTWDSPNDEYPFYYLENQTTGKEYHLNINKYLTYNSFNPENEIWDLPFILNQNSVKADTIIYDSKATMDEVVVSGNFVKSEFENGKSVQESNSLTDDYVNYTNKLEDGKLNIKINTVGKYLAEQTSQQVNSSSTSGFRGYMTDSNIPYIFGYNPETMSQPKYGLVMKVGRKDSKGRLNAGICEFTGTSYTADAKGKVLKQLDVDRTHRQWKNELCPAMVNALQESLQTSPTIFFLIGGDTDKWTAGSHGNSELKSRSSSVYTTDYNIVLWKGYNEDQNYYFLNQYFTKAGTETNGLASLQEIFKHIYTKQEFINSGTMYKSGNYSYTQNYKINYEGTLSTTYSEISEFNKLETLKGTDLQIENAIEQLKIILGDEMTLEQKNALLSSNNITINVTLPESTEHQVFLQAESPKIDDVVLRYTEASGQMSNGALSGYNGELIEFDFKGNPFNDSEMYYIGGDGLAYPVSNPTGLTGSDLQKVGVSVTTLNKIYKGFKVQYDSITKMYQIRINPMGIGSFTTNYNDAPRISSDNRAFYPASGDHGQGCLLDITLTSSAKTLR